MGWEEDLEESFWASGSERRPTTQRLLPGGGPGRPACCGCGLDAPPPYIGDKQTQPLYSHVMSTTLYYEEIINFAPVYLNDVL